MKAQAVRPAASALQELRTTPVCVPTASTDPTAPETSTNVRATPAQGSRATAWMESTDIRATVPADMAGTTAERGCETVPMSRALIMAPVFGQRAATSAGAPRVSRVSTVKKTSMSVCRSPAGTVLSVRMGLLCINATAYLASKVTTVTLTSTSAHPNPARTTGRASTGRTAISANASLGLQVRQSKTYSRCTVVFMEL